jgi:predicted secreted hydrolase
VRTSSAALAFLLVAAVTAPGATPSWDVVAPGVRISLPADLAPHPSFQTEWWYATGILRDDRGARYGVQWTLFRRGLDPSAPAPGEPGLKPRQALSGHLAVADLERETFRSAGRVRRVAAGLAGWREDASLVWLEDWEFEARPDGGLRLRASAEEKDMALDLVLDPGNGPVLQGDAGYSRKGGEAGNASAYFSLPRCAAQGTLELNGRSAPVAGTLWFDREWGTTRLGKGTPGWDWFGLRLEDGRDVTLYRLRNADGSAGPFSSCTLSAGGLATGSLGPSDFALEPQGFWESPFSGARYPVRWRLTVPSAGLDLQIRPMLEGCEVDGSRSVGAVYWEGPVEVSGSARGEGYMELTGY